MKKLPIQKIKATGDIPSPRFGHTLTMVSPTKAVLFGGAVSLAGRFVITNQTYLFDFPTSKWTKLNFKHEFVPSERAAHAAVAVSDMQMIIYGGAASGTQGLLKDELYILDIRKDPVWKIIEVSNQKVTPGQRYGHTMLFNKPFLVVFAGNSGNKAQNDVWLLNILKGPFTWQKYEFPNRIVPSPRVYHSAAICEEGSALGMMVVFGGRKETKKEHNGSQRELTVAALNDIWGLRKHRDGSWDWVTPPKSQTYTPICRYQHLVTFMGSMLVIMGGRSNNVEESVSQIQIYDTQKSQWSAINSVSRYRHAVALYNKTKLFVHGGFEPELASQPLESMISIDLSSLGMRATVNNWVESGEECSHNNSNNTNSGHNSNNNSNNSTQVVTKQSEKRQILGQNDNIQNLPTSNSNTPLSKMMMRRDRDLPPTSTHHNNTENQKLPPRNSRIKSTTSNFTKTAKERDLTPSRIINSIKNIRLSNQVVVAMGDNANMMQIQRVPTNSLLEQSKKLIITQEDISTLDINTIELAENIIHTLINLNAQQKNLSSTLLPFKREKVVRLAQEASKIVMRESSLVGVRPPVKIFGSIYGRFSDLLRIFQNFGYPDQQEMESNEYVFLGNYVDKGFNSLQTICLLMSLKIKYPDHITLLRGKHEDSTINRICGLGDECAIRLGENINQPSSVFQQLNNFFDCLPLAAAIQDKFLCVHSGIGSIENLVDIKDVVRPVKVRNSQVVMDLLWSGTKEEKRLNYESPACTDQQIEEFLYSNCLEMLINTRDGLPHGVDEQKHTLSVFSVTNYANSNNKAGILKINKNLTLLPYLLNSSPSKKSPWVTDLQTKSNLNFTSVELDIRSKMFEV